MQDSPFDTFPSPDEITGYFALLKDRRNRGYDGISLYNDGDRYCYLWVEAMIDFDYTEIYLLDIRTKKEGGETRQYIRVTLGGLDDHLSWEKHHMTLGFSDTRERHAARLADGLRWFTEYAISHSERV